MTIFTFTGSAVGSPNNIIIPDDYKGEKFLEIVPPVGHAWTYFDPSSKNSVSRATDQTFMINRSSRGVGGFARGEIVGAVNLDLNSGTFTGILS